MHILTMLLLAAALIPEHEAPGGPPPATSFLIQSSILNEQRRVFVALPASFEHSAPEHRYPVMVVLDGEANTGIAASVAGQLAANGQIPEFVIVGIANRTGRTGEETSRLRVNDLTPPGLSVSGSGTNENGDKFLDFIERELLPAIDRQYRGAAPRVLIGHSSGGILATWAAATRPGFRAVIAIDTPTAFGGEWLPKRLMERARSRASTPLRYASFEARFGWRDDTWRSLVAAAPRSWRLHREHLDHESHETIPMLAIHLGLRDLFTDYSQVEAPGTPGRIIPYYDSLATALGASVAPPQPVLRRLIQDRIGEGHAADARDAYLRMTSAYGPPADSAAQLVRIGEVEKRPPPAETVEQLLATPFPTPDQARAYLGEWVGHVWMPPDEPRNEEVTLRIRTENGKVVGETVTPDAPPEYRVRRFEYLKVTPHGITWGFMNGMRPRGVAMFEATAHGDTLSGASRFGGIDFKLDDGSAPPSLHFEFVRKR